MKKIIILGLLLTTSLVHARTGSEGVGGGDLCEDRIKIIRDDLSDWIKKGGPNGLSLPTDISLDQYSSAMLDQIDHAKVKCVSEGDEGFPVSINGVAKVCRFDADQNEGQITCDYNKFRSIKESDQYILIHHEFAGLANLEIPNGPDSNYSISNQISGYLVNQVIKKLSVKPGQDAGNELNFNALTYALSTPSVQHELNENGKKYLLRNIEYARVDDESVVIVFRFTRAKTNNDRCFLAVGIDDIPNDEGKPSLQVSKLYNSCK